MVDLKNTMQEKRKHPRLEKNIPVKICSDDMDFVTETTNLSCSGVYCRVNKYVQPMTKLKLHILLPVKKQNKITAKKISCSGVIVRSESIPGNDDFCLAIYFSEMNRRDSTYIFDYIQSVLEQRWKLNL